MSLIVEVLNVEPAWHEADETGSFFSEAQRENLLSVKNDMLIINIAPFHIVSTTESLTLSLRLIRI